MKRGHTFLDGAKIRVLLSWLIYIMALRAGKNDSNKMKGYNRVAYHVADNAV